MKRLMLIFATATLTTVAVAQETYENANIATEDLNGTARYVGMGGAMDALGADISTIGTNPAGIGLFRHSTANISFGLTTQQASKNFNDKGKTNANFDQVGFVYSRRTGRNSFLNVAFNYHKSRNFNQILSAVGNLKGTSQNKLTYNKCDAVESSYASSTVNLADNMTTNNYFNQVDYLYYNTLLLDENGQYYYNDATGYRFDRKSKGYIGEYDFNISGNINDRVYLGLTFGISDVHYTGYSEYTEYLINSSNTSVGSTTLTDERRITGTGFNIKAGIIVRPIEDNPFRFGLSVATPTWYDLTTRNSTILYNDTNVGLYSSSLEIPTDDGHPYYGESYDFKLYTPWKFGVSLGTTVDNYLAIGAGYEYADYGNLDSRINTGGGWDYYYNEYYDTSDSDIPMNDNTSATLKGVSTFKVGAELKTDANFSIRLGYNYVSPMYEKHGCKDYGIKDNSGGTAYSPGSFYSSSTDYTNWEATHRITCGLGYSVAKISVDLAYQYSSQTGTFTPYKDLFSANNDGVNSTKVDNKRHQVLLTLGYHF